MSQFNGAQNGPAPRKMRSHVKGGWPELLSCEYNKRVTAYLRSFCWHWGDVTTVEDVPEKLLKIDPILRNGEKKGSDLGKTERRNGRWQGRNPAAVRLLDVVRGKDEKQRARGRPWVSLWNREGGSQRLLIKASKSVQRTAILRSRAN